MHSTLALSKAGSPDAERLAVEASDHAELLSGAEQSGAYGVQMFSLRREQGRLEEVRPVVEAVVRLGRAHATWRPGLAAVYAELGMLDEAARKCSTSSRRACPVSRATACRKRR